MYRKILVIVLVLIAVGLVGCGTTPSPTPTPSETVNLESPLYIIEGENQVEGFRDFFEKMELIYGNMGILGGYPLVEGVEEYIENIRECNSILVIPPIPEGIQEYCNLESKYPDLCPLSSVELEFKLESYSSPLIYLTYDIQTGTLRVVIVADRVDESLAKLLAEEELPLNVSFREEDGQLILLE